MISADQGSPLKQRSFLLFLLTRSFSRFSSQVAAVAIGWQIYDLTGSAFDLGMVGLVQFLPTALLVFVAGHAADRYQRKRVVQICQLAQSLTALFLAWGAYSGSWSLQPAWPVRKRGDRCLVRRGAGGLRTIAIALLWMKLFPTLREVERLG
jgi:MFS family permease